MAFKRNGNEYQNGCHSILYFVYLYYKNTDGSMILTVLLDTTGVENNYHPLTADRLSRSYQLHSLLAFNLHDRNRSVIPRTLNCNRVS